MSSLSFSLFAFIWGVCKEGCIINSDGIVDNRENGVVPNSH